MAIESSSINCEIDRTDIDTYGHLNNGRFSIYFEKGQLDLAIRNGLDTDVLTFWVGSATYGYNTPVLAGQSVEIRSTSTFPVTGTGAQFGLKQGMFLNDKLVASCEISGQNVVGDGYLSNAVFPGCFEKGRLDLAIRNGLDAEALDSKGLAFLVRKAVYDYHAPVLKGEKIKVKSIVDSVRKARVIVNQKMIVKDRLVSSCEVDYFFENAQSGKPVRVPDGFLIR